MKKNRSMQKIGFFALALNAFLFSVSCNNPYIIHDLEQPVYLTGIEVRSNILAADDPGHPLNELFRNNEFVYTVTVPYNAEQVTINGFPEEGAILDGGRTVNFNLLDRELNFTLTARKEHRQSSAYTLTVLRGLPEAVLSGIELYIGDDNVSDDLDYFEENNYVVNFVPVRDTYTVKVPSYTNHLAFVLRSFTGEAQKISSVSYEFKDWDGNTIGPGGRDKQEEFTQVYGGDKLFKQLLPDWYPDSVIDWGNLTFFPGGDNTNPTWFGTNTVVAGDNKKGEGKLVTVVITASVEKFNNETQAMEKVLTDKTYTIEIQREEGAAYLKNLEVFSINGSGLTGATDHMPETDGSGDDTNQTKRLRGSFSKTNRNYDAFMPEDANAVRIIPALDDHVRKSLAAGSPGATYTFITYYYDKEGVRYFIDENGVHKKHEIQLGDPPLPDIQSNGSPNQLTRKDIPDALNAENPPHLDLFYRSNDPNFSRYVRMEVVILVEAEAPLDDIYKTMPPYRLMVYRQNKNAELYDIKIKPYEPLKKPLLPDASIPWPGAVDAPFTFQSLLDSQDPVNVDAGMTHAQITLDNDNNPDHEKRGSVNRKITVSTSTGTIGFRETSGGWYDAYNNFLGIGVQPFADIELNSRNTEIKVRVEDLPGFTTREYILNILTKNSNSIILPVDADNNGKVKAVFASGSNIGLAAVNVLPGELIELTVEANLGYFIDWTKHQYNIASGIDGGVSLVGVSTISMGSGVRLYSANGPEASAAWKKRIYRFYMPDENVEFHVDYRDTAMSQDKIAYVASKDAGGSRSGGFQAKKDGTPYDKNVNPFPPPSEFDTATSWGTASTSLQAVINSYDGDNFKEIWVLQGEYYPPEAAELQAIPGAYGYTPLNDEDRAFILVPGIKIYGGFIETDETNLERSNLKERSQYTVLNGEFPDGTGAKAHHVVVAADADSAVLHTLTIRGGMGSIENAGNISINGKPINRQRGGGVYMVNGDQIKITNVIIRNNSSTYGAGMYTLVDQYLENAPQFSGIQFFNNNSLQQGGGLYLDAAYATSPLIEYCDFLNNDTSNRGGGMYLTGADCRPRINFGLFRSNHAKEGGGIFSASGTPIFNVLTVSNSRTSGNGAGIYIADGSAEFRNLTVISNNSTGGGGVGIFNSGIIKMGNATIAENECYNGGTGGGIYNAGTAVIANATIRDNTVGSGGGVFNSGRLEMANCIVRNNTAAGGNGGGLENVLDDSSGSTMTATVAALLVNVTLKNNSAARGGAIYNQYEGYPTNAMLKNGSINLLLNNAEITLNTSTETQSGAIHNRYFRWSGRGINLTFTNTTIAGNIGSAAVYTVKDGATNVGAPFGYYGVEDPENPFVDADAADNKKAFPVYIRFRNSVAWNNGQTSIWTSPGFSDVTNETILNGSLPKSARETYDYSLLQGMGLGQTEGDHNVNDLAQTPGFEDGYWPGSALAEAANPDLYPDNPDAILEQLFWKIGNDASLDNYKSFLVYTSSMATSMNITNFLHYDNSFNIGDLRLGDALLDTPPALPHLWAEGPKDKERLGSYALPLSIGAYQPK
jgi:hypothetical protein